MKKFYSLLLLVVLFTSIPAVTVRAENYVTPAIYVDGKLYEFKNNLPILRNDRVLVPLKSGLFQAVGATIQYDIINKEITLKTKNHVVSNFLYELVWWDYGIKCYNADVRSDQVNDDIYVPLRAALESLGYDVYFSSAGYRVVL
jgi:hypothetical protein